ncbi:probable LRR receptor-like serine/threonine-protein kinase At1g56140 [Hibiscus syriacus]|uniref:probable LRR receptor-like serine/threonine-protein kinase At1g56140 n=1 Tax=Hibiscus syriacus TaxID=106335 RepID=UPI001924C3FC|nr:probable LRR receptor-like serine/threonine-protein kinase At1g56140 [Hibiscus syriacus]
MLSKLTKPLLSSSKCFLFFFIVVLFWCSQSIKAQNAATDPSEVKALNSIFRQWDTQAGNTWNHSGEPCNGVALNQNDSVFEDPSNNPTIRRDCSFNTNTLCHITRLKVVDLNRRGEIPKELLDLTFLNYLKIDQNFFSGHLPAFVGNMLRLEFLSIAFNDFSGSIPKELGNLKELRMLSLGNNNFSGTLPPELGNLTKLEDLYINRCKLGGDIPSTFANLIELRTVWISKNGFSGKIPDFIGNNWTKLIELNLQGNSFEGPIPSSFANLTSLATLKIDGIYNGSSLGFLRNLKNLHDLDLSFNNLTCTIPSEMFTMDSVKYLFLGNNSLAGAIPNQPTTLHTIDLSYNLLSGDLPYWADKIPQLNLVGNNFTLNNSNIRLLPGSECLKRRLPCNRNAPRYAKFSIKCGGQQTISDGILFEADNKFLGAATYDVTSTRKWEVSNIGEFAEQQNQNQTSRLFPGSLRYYGLGLDNGDYTVNLSFAEIGFPNEASKSRSGARRVFDVYIQGTRRLRGFDISKEEGTVEKAITKSFTAKVTGNHLEIQVLWAGNGTSTFQEEGIYGPSVSAISVVPNAWTVGKIPPKEKKWTTLIAVITVSVVVLALILICTIIYMRSKRDDEYQWSFQSSRVLKVKSSHLHFIAPTYSLLIALLDSAAPLDIGTRPSTFSYSKLKAATEDFNPSNKLGEGGFGAVYRGTFSDGRVIAVKQLAISSKQGKSQFTAEISTISAVQHRNLVKLHGYCIKGKRHLLVYEYLENKSLDQTLFGLSDLHLDWPTRFNICLETSRGLAYLHEESRPRIVHRDIKASNILLDAELCPKISDFGLAKLYDDTKTHVSTRVAGTIGYLAPEYALRGHLTEKADVFSFGIVALEILSGRPNSDNSLEDHKIYLLEWAWTLHEKNRSLDLVDPNLAEFDENEALRVVMVALLCTQGSPSMRPPMSRVVSMLAGDIEVSGVITRPSYLTDWSFKDLTGENEIVSEYAVGQEETPILFPVNVNDFSDITAGRTMVHGREARTLADPELGNNTRP